MNQGKTNVLLVGSEGTGKHDISNCLVDMGRTINLSVLTCSCLPLSGERDVQQENVQFVCFVMHMANKDSMKTLVASIGQLDVSYFIGKSVIVANTKGQCTDEGVQCSQLKNLAAKYDLQVLYCDTENQAEKTELCRKLMRMIEASVGLRRNVTPLLFETVQSVSAIDSYVDSSRKTSLEKPVLDVL